MSRGHSIIMLKQVICHLGRRLLLPPVFSVKHKNLHLLEYLFLFLCRYGQLTCSFSIE